MQSYIFLSVKGAPGTMPNNRARNHKSKRRARVRMEGRAGRNTGGRVAHGDRVVSPKAPLPRGDRAGMPPCEACDRAGGAIVGVCVDCKRFEWKAKALSLEQAAVHHAHMRPVALATRAAIDLADQAQAVSETDPWRALEMTIQSSQMPGAIYSTDKECILYWRDTEAGRLVRLGVFIARLIAAHKDGAHAP